MDTSLKLKTKQTYSDIFINDGVCVFKQLFNHEQLQTISDEVTKIRQMVMTKVATLDRPLKTYSDIAERELGRFDYRCGFTAAIFNQLALPIVRLVNELSPHIDFRHYWGAIPSLGGAGPTAMHRDVYPLLNTSDGNNLDKLDINLPPYYFTVLIPLVNITHENGPTQFVKGSHQNAVVDENTVELYSPLLSLGDIVMFDGRTLHRGSANKTKDERVIAYITFVANWYHDQTFTINEYLFPELAMKGL